MEHLVSVEIIEDHCQCCLRFLRSMQCSKVTKQQQEIFFDLISQELIKGLICGQCSKHLSLIQSFRTEILASRNDHEAEFFEEVKHDLVEEDYVIEPAGHEEDPSTTRIHEVEYKREKPTKLKSLLTKYNVQFAQSDAGRSTKSPKVICPVCEKILTLLSLPLHLKAHEGIREYNFMCEICSKKCASNAELTVHRRRHTKEKPYQCDRCPQSFFNCKKNLIQHLRAIHLNQRKLKKEREQCGICLKKFGHNYLVNYHMRRAHPLGIDDGVRVNPETDHYHCQVCGGQYKTRRYFDNHVCITGAGDGPTKNACPICRITSKSRFDTIKHIQEEHAERLDETRWKCRVCDTIVLDKIVLHVESVHTQVSSKCSFCNKELKNRRCLRNHIYVVHENGSEVRKQKRKTRKLEGSNSQTRRNH